MVKRKTRETEALFVNSTKPLTDRSKTLNKIYEDLRLTTIKQKQLEQLRRSEYHDCKGAAARNALHGVSELTKSA